VKNINLEQLFLNHLIHIQALRYINFSNMRNSKLHSVLKEFDKYEQNRCRKYIQSPYFNRSEKIAELYEFFIGKSNEGEQEEDFTKESIWEVLHSQTEFNSNRWRKYCSDLLKLIEGYLIQEEFEKDKPTKIAYLMNTARNGKIDVLSKIAVKKSNSFLKEKVLINQENFYNSYNLEKRKYRLQQSERQRTAVSNIEKIISNLDNFYLIEKLKYYCDILSRKSTVSHNFEVKLIDQIIDFLSKEKEAEIEPAVGIYYKMVLIVKDFSNEKHYFELKDLLKENAAFFSKEEASEMYTFAVNYITRQLNSGNSNYWREYFEIHQQLLKDKIIIVNGELNAGIFKNIVAAGVRLSEVKWTENFISEYSKYLPENQRENAITFNSAILYFHQEKYNDVISLLQQVEYEDYIYNVSSKQLLLRTYYETKADDPLFFLIDSFRAYLYRNPKISTKMKETYSNFLTITKKLARTNKRDKKTLESLKQEINEKKNLANRSWLKEKVEEKE
jgi:hypothetical protein